MRKNTYVYSALKKEPKNWQKGKKKITFHILQNTG